MIRIGSVVLVLVPIVKEGGVGQMIGVIGSKESFGIGVMLKLNIVLGPNFVVGTYDGMLVEFGPCRGRCGGVDSVPCRWGGVGAGGSSSVAGCVLCIFCGLGRNISVKVVLVVFVIIPSPQFSRIGMFRI